MPWLSRRAAGGLRRPSESRVLLAFMARATCCRCAGPAKRPLAFDRDYASKRRSTEDPKGMALTTGIQGIGPSASCWRRRIPSTSLCGRKLYYLRYDRAKNTDPRSLSTSTTMITGPDRNRRHMMVSALSLPSRRATGGLRRPSESRALLAFPRLSLPAVVSAQQPNRPFDRDYASKQRRPEDPKGMYIDAGFQGICTSASRSRRWIPSISS